MEEILHHPGCKKARKKQNPVNNGLNYQPQVVSEKNWISSHWFRSDSQLFLGVDNPLRYGSYGQTHKSPEGLRLILTKSGEDHGETLGPCRTVASGNARFFMSGVWHFPPPKKFFF